MATLLPARRPDLLIKPLGEDRYVVKDPITGEFFQIGEAEHFLLIQLDGQKDGEAICTAYAERFDEPLSEEELDEFVNMAQAQGLLRSADESREESSSNPKSEIRNPKSKQSILHWRKSLWDPDRLFTWLAPRLWFFWTRTFLVISAGCILIAVLLVFTNRHEVASSFADVLRWETAIWAWLTILVVTLLHECAHGLTCKHHGGEVHEIGFLMMFFMPCFYCNVSDAWLLKEKSKRLWVTFAGGYVELWLWALAVFIWRLTVPGSFPNYLAFIVLTACGVQTLFNFLPLLKLDGYYLLSDYWEQPNLHQRSLGYFKGQARRLLWGAPGPATEKCGRRLFWFGAATWLFSLAFLVVTIWGLSIFAGTRWGWVGLGGALVLASVGARSLFRGFTEGEVAKMITQRRKRAAIWMLAVSGIVTGLCVIEIEDRAGGAFQVRPAVRQEVRAPVAGFLAEVYFDEGERVSPGALLVRLEIPDLDSRIAQKGAEVNEANAKLRLLQIGSRPEKLEEQRRCVERAEAWRNLAREDLVRAKLALDADLTQLDKLIAQHQAELEAADDALRRAKPLKDTNVLTAEQYKEGERRQQVHRAQRAQALAQRQTREARGVMEAETELAKREKELADAKGALRLLEAGSRTEEVEAARAQLARLREEGRNLEDMKRKLSVMIAVPGVVTTARLREKIGQYFKEGDLICVIEEPAAFEAEIALPEEETERVVPGQPVRLKPRALTGETLTGQVERIAPAGKGDAHVTAYCRIDSAPAGLRAGTTGYARITTGQCSVAGWLADRGRRLLRTEFWW